jgi:uncharacterized protein YaiE (UPF0345 family)
MKDLSEFLQSGVIEAYVLGMASPEEMKEVEGLAVDYPEVTKAIDSFSESIEQQALENAVAPDPLIKPMLMATFDYLDRMGKGETPAAPPDLTANSRIDDYAEWLNKETMASPADFSDIYARLISYIPGRMTAIVWIKEMAPQEIHHDEHERFLVVEGTCTINIEGEPARPLKAGEFLAIPLHKNHSVNVTSAIPCKVILQRLAA